MFLLSCVFRWFPSSTFLVCLFEPWRWHPQAIEGLSKLRLAGLLCRVGFPILDKPQRMSRGALLTCSFPSKVSSHLRAVSHCLNSISRLVHRCSQRYLHWTSHKVDRDSPSLLRTTRPQPAPVVYQPSGNDLTPPAGANANSDAIVNAQLTHLVSRDDEAQGQGATSNQDALMPDASMVRDIATPRRTTGARCRKVVHQCTACPRETQVCCLLYVRNTIRSR